MTTKMLSEWRRNKLALKAWYFWAKERGKNVDRKTQLEFAALVGEAFDGQRNFIIDINNPVVMERIEKILGPHGVMFLKLLEIQNERKIL